MKPDLEMWIILRVTVLAYSIAFKYGVGMTIFSFVVYFFITSQGVIFDVKTLKNLNFFY